MREEIKEKGIIRESRWKPGNETQFTIFFCGELSSARAPLPHLPRGMHRFSILVWCHTLFSWHHIISLTFSVALSKNIDYHKWA